MAGDVRRFGGRGREMGAMRCCCMQAGVERATGDASDAGERESIELSPASRKRRTASACARLGPLTQQQTATIPASCLTTAPTYRAHAPNNQPPWPPPSSLPYRLLVLHLPTLTSLLLHVGVAEHVSRYSPPSPNLTRHDAL